MHKEPSGEPAKLAPSVGPSLTRRSMLKWGLMGVGAVTFGGAALALRKTILREQPAAGLSVLTLKEYSILAAVADRICPSPGPGLPNATGLAVASQLDAGLAPADPEVQDGVRLALAMFESGLVGAAFGERLAPFTQLSPAEQDRALQAWCDSGVPFRRQVFRALKSLCAATYYGDGRSWSLVGYDGPPSRSALRAGYAINLIDYDALRPKG